MTLTGVSPVEQSKMKRFGSSIERIVIGRLPQGWDGPANFQRRLPPSISSATAKLVLLAFRFKVISDFNVIVRPKF
jgi:hypothetical protein